MNTLNPDRMPVSTSLINMGIIIEGSNDRLKLRLQGILVIVDIDRIMSILLRQLRKKPSVIEIDCKELTFIDSSVIGAMIWFITTVKQYGIKLEYSNLELDISNINKLFEAAKEKKTFTVF
ncbi:MAG: STAS domain-containing protein [bacterium]|nr:STAS domain-containing protein [bacterium]